MIDRLKEEGRDLKPSSKSKEYIDYEKVEDISYNLLEFSTKMQITLDKINKYMNEIDKIDSFKSNASSKILEKFNETSSKFYKFYKEVEANALYLETKIIEYDIKTNNTKNYIEETTKDFLERLGNYGK